MLIARANKVSEIDSLTKVVNTIESDTLKVKTLNALAKVVLNVKATEALDYAIQANKLAKEINYVSGVAYSSDIMGVIYLRFGDSKKALYHHFVAQEIFKNMKDFKGEAFTYNNIGAVFSYLKNYSKAAYYYQLSINIKTKSGFFKEISSSLINLGNIEMKSKNITKCISYYSLALDNATKFKDYRNMTIALINLGEAYIDLKNNYKALFYYKKALPIIERTGGGYHKAYFYFALGRIYLDQKHYNLAEYNLNEALKIAAKIESKSLCLNIYKQIYLLYKEQNKFEKALFFNELYLTLSDTLFNQENVKNINEMQARFDLKEKEEQIKNLNIERKVIEANKSKDELVKKFLIVGIIFISIITIITFWIVYNKQKTNRILILKNTKIQIQQLEIEKINKELNEYNKELMKENVFARYEILKAKINPHFLFNSLSTLSSLIIHDKKQALSFVTKFAKLYRSILELSNTQLISIKEELEVVQSYLYLCKMKYEENLVLNIDNEVLNVDGFLPPFSLQLLIENVVKHNIIDFNKVMVVDVYLESDYIVVKNLLNPKVDDELSTGLGKKNIIERYKFISDKLPYFEILGEFYIAKVPLIKNKTEHELHNN